MQPGDNAEQPPPNRPLLKGEAHSCPLFKVVRFTCWSEPFGMMADCFAPSPYQGEGRGGVLAIIL